MADTSRRPGGLIGALRRMVSSPAERDADDRQAQEGTRLVGDCADRERVAFYGTIHNVASAPSDQPPRLEADFDDGSGHVLLIWMGRCTIAGITAGVRLRIEGRLSCQGSKRTIYNPRYELIHVPGVS